MPGTVENRVFPRTKLRSALCYKVRGQASSCNSVMEDVSAGGLCFNDQKFIAPNSNLMLEFNVLSRLLTPIGKVVWANPIPRSDKYRMGIQFVEISDTQRAFISDYVSMQQGKL